MSEIRLFNHQKEAIRSWLSANKRGILSMATGTGKTYTAIGALNHVTNESERFFTLITVPYAHLISQWEKSLKNMNVPIHDVIYAYSGSSNWKKKFKVSIRRLYNGSLKKLLVVSTHDSLRNSVFQDINILRRIPTMIIGDEVHGLGSSTRKQSLSKIHFNYRLGLSATPWRMWDEEGSNFIREYFGDVIYEFSLEKATTEINPLTGKTYLTPYKYFPYFAFLTDSEMRRYLKLTMSVIKEINKYGEGIEDLIEDKTLSMLLFKRANIIKRASEKMKALVNILGDIQRRGINSHILIYVEDKKQLGEACRYITTLKMSCEPFIMDLSSKKEKRLGNKSERDYVLSKFARGEINVLVSMRILDEGVDVPQAKVGVLMASSTNSRQYIQRLGRILRRSEDKEIAYIYDIVVLPHILNMKGIYRRIEESILRRELARYIYISQCAVNRFDAERLLYKYVNELGVVLDANSW